MHTIHGYINNEKEFQKYHHSLQTLSSFHPSALFETHD